MVLRRSPYDRSNARKKGRTLRFFALRCGQWSNPQGFDDLQIGERTPKRTQIVNRRFHATRGRGDGQGRGGQGGGTRGGLGLRLLRHLGARALLAVLFWYWADLG
ncbi:hypothetical protein PVK06_016697 [Gossypium arboreum]|uniref:Uncharacterized protein n=1 Tax=Gossypium arboreum TaxID=29729 RepID=A0ABR0Q160_GOSAR|nr:hypothetical protein PVK06_016697 [Gossypium arboreum]